LGLGYPTRPPHAVESIGRKDIRKQSNGDAEQGNDKAYQFKERRHNEYLLGKNRDGDSSMRQIGVYGGASIQGRCPCTPPRTFLKKVLGTPKTSKNIYLIMYFENIF
jgi:hypothetical protein